jgi:hypothetical protein
LWVGGREKEEDGGNSVDGYRIPQPFYKRAACLAQEVYVEVEGGK